MPDAVAVRIRVAPAIVDPDDEHLRRSGVTAEILECAPLFPGARRVHRHVGEARIEGTVELLGVDQPCGRGADDDRVETLAAHHLRIGEALAAAHQRAFDRERERHHVEWVDEQDEQRGRDDAAGEDAQKQHDETAPVRHPSLSMRLRLPRHRQNWK
jgi:hypothetical protein